MIPQYFLYVCRYHARLIQKSSLFTTVNKVDHYGYLNVRYYSFPSQAQVVICGGGIIGNSVSFHLTSHGWKDIVILEQGRMGCGTTWHSSGIVSHFQSPLERALISYSVKLYQDLEDEGYDIGWKKCGGLLIGKTRDRMISFRRIVEEAKVSNLECHMIDRREIVKLVPSINIDDIEGGVWVPEDGTVNSLALCKTLSQIAADKGVHIIEECPVHRVNVENNRVESVETKFGEIKCEYFVNCAGMWAREVGRLSTPKVRVPVHACEHMYIITKPVEGLDYMTPCVTDLDCNVFFRQYEGGMLAGGFELESKPVFHDGIPKKFQFQLLPEDWEHFQTILNAIEHRFPVLKHADIKQMVNGPECFTPDGRWIIGEDSEVCNYFIAAGMNSKGVMGAGGIGKELAERIVKGASPYDLWSVDVKRFIDVHNNKKYLKDRASEIVGWQFDIKYPLQSDFSHGRRLRCSPLHSHLEEAGAVFGERMGFERPLWFDKYRAGRGLSLPTAERPRTFGKPPWFESVEEEYFACREGVALIEMSSFTKYEVQSAGTEVVHFLQYLCSNDVDILPGGIVHTGMQNHNGGYENECVLLRVQDNIYFMISPTSQTTRAVCWMKKHLPTDGSISINDVTSKFTVVSVVGPRFKDLISELSGSYVNISPLSCMIIDLGYASGILAVGVTNTGEPGCTLYIPSEYAYHVYSRLMELGQDYGIRNAGYFTVRYLGIEKLLPFWERELDSRTTPFEVGRGFRIKFEKEDFIGKGALMRQRDHGVYRRLVQLQLENHDLNYDIWPWGGEPIYRNGIFVGMTTSAAYAFTFKSQVCLGFITNFNLGTKEYDVVTNNYLTQDTQYEVNIAGKRFPARIQVNPPRIPIITMETLSTRYMPKPTDPSKQNLKIFKRILKHQDS